MKEIEISMTAASDRDLIYFVVDCETLIDKFEYHDAPDQVHIYPRVDDIKVLRDKLNGIIEQHEKNEMLREQAKTILAQGVVYVVEWLKERGWKVHFPLTAGKATKVISLDNTVDFQIDNCLAQCTKRFYHKVNVEFAVFHELLTLEQGQED